MICTGKGKKAEFRMLYTVQICKISIERKLDDKVKMVPADGQGNYFNFSNIKVSLNTKV